MSKINAQTVEEKRKSQFRFFLFLSVIVLIVFIIILFLLVQSNNKKNITYEGIRTVEDVLNYYGCKYISEKESKEEGFYTEIRTIFKYDLYDGEKSNEEFYNNLINDLARILDYYDFIIIDSEKDITIKVVCENGKITEIIINDISNYFIYMDSQIAIKKYKEIPEIDLQIESPIIQFLIENNWTSNINFGTRESIFEKYYEYFDEGIKTRTIDGKIYNILFTTNYKSNVVNGIFPGMDLRDIERIIGTPTFKDENLKVIGYKGKNIYVFFTEKEISVYRVENINASEFFKLVDKLLTEEIEILEFMNELTYLWPDYSEYKYDEDYAFISYPLKGIDIKLGYEDTDAIVLYNNVKTNKETFSKYLENQEFVSNLGIDNVFEAEKRRIISIKDLNKKTDEYKDNLDEEDRKMIRESKNFKETPVLDYNENIIKILFISQNANNPNRELYESVSDYIWINDDIIVYSQYKKGIYLYNVTNGSKQNIEKGQKNYKLKSFENGILKYDNEEIFIMY